MSANLTDAQFAAYIDRILECRKLEDEAKEDTKLVYTELADAGGDKTAAGLLVRALRMDEKQAGKAQARQELVEEYRDRYRRGKASHVRAREDSQSYAEVKGAQPHNISAPLTGVEIEELSRRGPGEITEHEQPETATQSQSANPVRSEGAKTSDAGSVAGTASLLAEKQGDKISASHSNPQPSPLSGADKPEAASPPAVSGALSDGDVPAFLKRDHAPKPAGDKPNCLKLKDGHCKIGFATSALCAECNAAKARALA